MSDPLREPSLVSIELVERGVATTVKAPEGARVADVLRREGYALEYDCGGRGLCGRCSAPLGPPGAELAPVPTCQARVDRRGLRVDVSSLRKLAETRSDVLSSDAVGAPSFDDGDPLGLAVDLGTTSLAFALVSLASGRVLATEERRNPQTTYGRDVISRIVSARRFGAVALQRLVCAAIGDAASSLAARVGARLERVEEIAIAGNTTMEFLLTGRDPEPLGVAPFEVGPRFFEERRASAYPFDVPELAEARVRAFPVFSAFVGGDVLAGFERLRSQGAFDGGGASLLLDVGTNGEALLATNGLFYATSTAAGPAFEGAEVSQGSLAIPGAIVGIDYDAATRRFSPQTYDGSPARSVCGSGVAATLACALDFGLMTPTGRFRTADAPELSAAPIDIRSRLCVEGRERSMLISSFSELSTTGGVRFTQTDARHAQLAVAATRAGRRIMLELAGLEASALERVWLAGSFGASLGAETARRIGLTPHEIPSSRTRVVGNASLLGAIDALTGRVSWSQLEKDVELVAPVNLASYPRFAEVFAECARFPEVER